MKATSRVAGHVKDLGLFLLSKTKRVCFYFRFQQHFFWRYVIGSIREGYTPFHWQLQIPIYFMLIFQLNSLKKLNRLN